MTVRTGYVGTEAVGDVLTKANFDKLPGGWLGYAEVTANQSTITTAADLTGLSVTVTVGANRRIRITGHGVIQRTVADGVTVGYILQAGTIVGRWAETRPAAATSFDLCDASVVTTPAAGSTIYKLQLETTTGTGSSSLQAAAQNSAFILVEDIGPAS